MAFYDQLKDSQNAANLSAKNLTETSNLNSQVKEVEESINELYQKLGREIYQAYRQVPMAEGADLIAQITALHEKVDALNAQIMSLTCTACGAVLEDGALFCTNCGCKVTAEEPAPACTDCNPIPAALENPVPKCISCGAVLEEGALFCTNCGTRLTEGEPPAPRCTNCGVVLEEGNLFYTNCGTRI